MGRRVSIRNSAACVTRGHLQYRTNNALIQTFNTDSLNQLTTVARTNTFTVAGMTSVQASNVTVNGQTAIPYTDNTFAKEGITLTNGANSFTAISTDWQGNKDTNTVSVNLPTTATFTYDGNGNMKPEIRNYDVRDWLDYEDRPHDVITHLYDNQVKRETIRNRRAGSLPGETFRLRRFPWRRAADLV